jgi:predicted dehydrogenase
MRVLVAGTGSVGRRHIANLCRLGCEVVAYSYRGIVPEIEGIGTSFALVTEIEGGWRSKPDALVVANSTEQHLEVALEAARRGIHLYIEKPLSISFDGLSELTDLVQAKQLIVEAGFMLRFHPNLVWMKHFLASGQLGELMYLRAAVGQWLPDWRSGTDYRLGYSADPGKGGGVIFDLIHELDLVNWLGGRVIDVSAMSRDTRLLEIQSEAIAQIGLRLESKALAQVHLDYVRPRYCRTLEVVGHRGVLHWDYSQRTVTLEESEGNMSVVHSCPPEFDRNKMFLMAMTHFLYRISDSSVPPVSSLKDGIESLRVALACHRSVSERRNICPDEID